MDGASLLYKLRQVLNEYTDSDLLDNRTSYSYLWSAATEFVEKTRVQRATQSITTVADQAAYDLKPDFIELYLESRDGRSFIKYTDSSSNDHFIYEGDYDNIVLSNNSNSVSIPARFAIVPKTSLPSQVTGTTTSAGAASAGQCTLTDTAGDFSDVEAGDIVHNTTDGSVGMVLSKTSTTVLVTALFNGTNNDWSSADAYVIQPQMRFQIVLDPAPSTASETVTVQYVQRPAPVYSSYGAYRIPSQYQDAIVKYAAWLYKYKDREPDMGDAFYVFWERMLRSAMPVVNRTLRRRGFRMNLKARR